MTKRKVPDEGFTMPASVLQKMLAELHPDTETETETLVHVRVALAQLRILSAAERGPATSKAFLQTGETLAAAADAVDRLPVGAFNLDAVSELVRICDALRAQTVMFAVMSGGPLPMVERRLMALLAAADLLVARLQGRRRGSTRR